MQASTRRLMPAAEISVMKGRRRPASAGLRANGPQPEARARVGLAQRIGSGRTGLGQGRPAGEGRGECVVANARREFCRSDPEFGWKIGCGGAAQAVAAAPEAAVVLMLVMG
jgi:hypothetical protein